MKTAAAVLCVCVLAGGSVPPADAEAKPGPAFKPFATKVLRGGQEAEHVVVDVTGVKDLYLVATVGPDNYDWDQAVWGDPILRGAAGKVTPLTALKPAAATVGWGQLVLNKDQNAGPLRVGKRTFKQGLWAHAPSVLRFRLAGKYRKFEAYVGIGVAAGRHGSVQFKVLDKPVKLPGPKPGARRGQPAQPPGPLAPDPKAMRLAIEDLIKTFPKRYAKGPEYLRRLEAIAAGEEGDKQTQALRVLQREALLGNPLLDFDELLLIRRNFGRSARRVISGSLGMPTLNAHTNDTIRRSGWDNEIVALSDLRGEGKFRTIHKSRGGRPITDLELHFDGRRIMFSSIGAKQNNWRLFEILADGTALRQLTPDDGADVGHFDSCYLPDLPAGPGSAGQAGGRIIFCSTATYQGLPCEFGGRAMVCLYIFDPRAKKIRQLTFEQDSDWCPTVLNSGRVMYLRWEYSDLPHSNSRILFHMNPDGTSQMEYYGSGSYFPGSFFFARPIPGHPTKVVGIAGGHHGISRSGRLLIVDPALGRREADGVVQEIPGRGRKVEPIVRDRLVDGVWPHFLHPYPLSGEYFLVSMKPSGGALWGVYLVDVFDNLTLIKEVEGSALLDPIPLRKTPRPPVPADRVDLKCKDAVVFLADVYRGGGLRGVPRGAVKKLRVATYYFSHRGTGGLLGSIGMDGPWDIKRVLGTVPVEADGSASFRIPANTPVFVHPLDERGQALQIMRSWFVGMPGESLSCVGCHEQQSDAAPVRPPIAFRRAPSEIEPWYGPVRGFSFPREVQPVLDKYCVGCHSGDSRKAPFSLRGEKMITDWSSRIAGNAGRGRGGKFSAAYAELHRYVRRPGIESDLRMLAPMEYHASTTELIGMLRKGHHNVRPDAEAWDRLVTWVDLNAPYHGTWGEIVGAGRVAGVGKRSRELRMLYAGVAVDYETIPDVPKKKITPIVPKPVALPKAPALRAGGRRAGGWTFSAREAAKRQAARGTHTMKVDLGEDVKLDLVWIPRGEFIMGSTSGHRDEQPPAKVAIDKGFWIGTLEVTNEQFARFDPTHDSRHESRHGYQFGRLGYPVNGPKQPVCRVSWKRAVAFCQWLGRTAGRKFTLPTEAQWEYACRAGTGTPFYYGGLDTDFSKLANLGDAKLKEFAACTARGGYTRAEPIRNPGKYDDWVPKDARFNDGAFLSVAGGRYKPNAWGLHDMHGNVGEWTRSAYRPYPYRADDGRNDPALPASPGRAACLPACPPLPTRGKQAGPVGWRGVSRQGQAGAAGLRVVRGGSWYERPKRCTSSFRLAYRPYQGVYNVGFRVAAAAE